MARRKALSPAEVLIAFFSVASQEDARALLLTARTITEARFPPPAKIAQVKKPVRVRTPKVVPPTPDVATARVATATSTAAPSPIGPGRRPHRARPPVPDAVVATALGVTPITLPDQGDPAEQEA